MNVVVRHPPKDIEGTQFQFPSNGKARVNGLDDITLTFYSDMSVSIPFKREGTCERKLRFERGESPGFNSLQTGRHV